MSHHAFKPPRSTRGQNIIVARRRPVTAAAEAERRTEAGRSRLMRDRRRGYGRLR